ncbi:MAG: type II CRISPR RNA-guided endonuclease Cas9 [Atopobiaceae bacterium]|nr:type II CRISPR RNA-guided endonuclease Cas9 [Atopobiaceae bacterium]
MNLRKAENYSIGLDLGTASVGWAVVGEEGTLYHIKGRPTWGSRLFSEAVPAADTRVKRGQRRRYERRRQRLDELQGLFLKEMEAVDAEFFVRLRQNRLLVEDRSEGVHDYRWPLFNSEDFAEAEYYKTYPTIYHLRKHLCESDEKADLRLVYLALHHIVKYRGNFLHEDEGASLTAASANAEAAAIELVDAVGEYVDEVLSQEAAMGIDIHAESEEIARILDAQGVKLSRKAEQIQAAFNPSNKDSAGFCKLIARASVGYKIDFAKLFVGIESSTETNFRLSDEEMAQSFVDDRCPDEAYRVFTALQSVYSSVVLSGILKGATSISEAMVRSYRQHKEDLHTLKALFKDYLSREEYLEFFRGQLDEHGEYDINALSVGSYTSYVSGEKKANRKGTSHEALVKQIRKLCDAHPALMADPRYERLADGINAVDDNTFLGKQRTRENGAIPYQLHLEEAIAIIDRQGAYYPFLKEKKELIVKLISSRIPYYVGPLNTSPDPLAYYSSNAVDHTRKFGWSVRRPGMEHANARPWNIDEVIDTDETAERFIRRMTGTCSYLFDEPVLPRHSLLYEEFCVLNELNGARWCERGGRARRFDYADKSDIFEQLFKRRASANVRYETVQNWLANKRGVVDAEVTGGQGETGFESKLATYHDFCKILGVRSLEDESPLTMDELEEIVLWNTVFEDRAIFKRKLQNRYGAQGDGRLNEAQIKKMVAKRYTGWGRLSKKLLVGIRVSADVICGSISIMDVLRDGNPFAHNRQMVFMEIVTDKDLGFGALIDEVNKEKMGEANRMLTIDDMQGSPANRRAVNQAMRILDEIVGIAGKPPTRICVEVTRDDDWNKKGRRTDSRYQMLKNALKAYTTDKELLSDLDKHKAELDDDRLLLYFAQQGKCMYTGQPLDIHQLQTYQIDHILPQSYIKDDSISNRVLVKSGANQRKLDDLLLDSSIINARMPWWRALRDTKLISEKKFRLLTRREVDERAFQGFINRQLVETSQVIKFVRQMCEQRYPSTDVVSVRANVSHGVRDNLGLVKSRELNNFHHAHDAFLACQVAEFVARRYPKWQDGFTLSMIRRYAREINAQRSLTNVPGKSGFIADSMTRINHVAEATGEVIWNCDEHNAYIRKALQYKTCFISVMPEIATGAFWDETVYSPRDIKSGRNLSMPLKSSLKPTNYEGVLDPKKYGGVSSVKQAYWFIFAAKDKRGKLRFFFEGVPIHLRGSLNGCLQPFAEELALHAGCSGAKILRACVPLRQKLELDGVPYYLYGSTGKSNEVRQANELVADANTTAMVAKLFAAQDNPDSDMDALYTWVTRACDYLSPKLAANMQLRERASAFQKLSKEDKAAQLRLLIGKMNRSAQTIDLKRIGGKPRSGYMTVSIASSLRSITWIDQSVTGIFERRTTFEDLCRGL